MNYCSISDAWGNKNNNIENFQPHNNIEKFHSYTNTNTNTIEHFVTDNNNNNTIEHFKPHNDKKFTKVKSKMSCDEILEHIQNCRYCNEKMKLKYNSNSNSNFIQNLTQNNKDTCILILVAIFVYLFFKLLNKI